MSELQGEYYILFVALIFPLLILSIKHLKTLCSRKSLPLPPGPTSWPFFGSIPRDLMGSMPLHAGLANLAKTYGPLMSVKIDSKRLIVASSSEAAREILKTNDQVLCGRYQRESLPKLELSFASIGWAVECTDEWKLLRSMCRKELFSNNALGNQAKSAGRNIGKLVNFLRDREGEAFKIADLVHQTSLNIVANALMSRDFISLEEYNKDGGLKSELKEFIRISTVRNVTDFFPVLSKLDPQGARRKIQECWKRLEAIYEPAITERRRKRITNSSAKQDLLDALLDIDFSDLHISVLFTELFTAGTDNLTTSTEWLLAELIKNPECMNKIRGEIENEAKEDFLSKDFSLMELPYLEACVKEVLRLHSPASYTMPHMARETCQVMNYTVPKNAQVLVNLWAIARDPSVWEEPLKFKPERFIESYFDFNGNMFEFLPFSSGRRMCPAMPMATKYIPWIVASLVHFFDLSLQNGADPAELNMEEKSGITTCMKHPLMLHFQARKA